MAVRDRDPRGISDPSTERSRSTAGPGHSIHQRIFSRAEMARAIGALAGGNISRTKAGARHVLSVPIVADLARDERLMAIARDYLGPAALPFRATMFDKSAAANWLVVWHQDTALPLRHGLDDPAWGPWSTKAGVLHAHAPAWALERVVALRVSLDESAHANGPLRVLPGTHRLGVLTDADLERVSRQVEPVDCLCEAGGVVAMRPLTVHASSKSRSLVPRRVVHIEYGASADLGAGVPLALG